LGLTEFNGQIARAHDFPVGSVTLITKNRSRDFVAREKKRRRERDEAIDGRKNPIHEIE